MDVNPYVWLVSLGLTVVALLTRSGAVFFRRSFPTPWWLQRSMQYAPMAALSAILIPELIADKGTLITTWENARLWGALAAGGFFFAMKSYRYVLVGTIFVGTLVYLPLHIVWGW